LKKYPSIDVRAVATSGSRDARNSPAFFAEVKEKFGIPVRVISGEEEALLSFRGALPDDVKDPHSIAVLDIGGGSTEVVGLKPGSEKELFRYSFDMGCVRLTERYLKNDPPLTSEIQELVKFVKADLAGKQDILDAVKGRILVGVAGTATYLASASLGLKKFDPERIDGYFMTREAIQKLIKEFEKLTAAQKLGLGGMDKGRADVILAGAYILDEVLALAGLSGFRASIRGLRYGAVLV
ncbi:MAG: Ppx/GppA phosphatase family protein, partial [Bdellovibrionota bacterium]